MTVIAQNLRKLRQALGVSIQDMAEFLGVDKKTLFDYEKGTLAMTADQVEKCVCLFDISEDDFVSVPVNVDDYNGYTELHLSSGDLNILADIGRISKNVEYMEDLIRRVDCQHCC